MKSLFTIMSLVATMAAAANTCEYDEALNALGPNRCSSSLECGGARYCSDWGWCHGNSGCDAPNQPDPVEIELGELQAEVDDLEG